MAIFLSRFLYNDQHDGTTWHIMFPFVIMDCNPNLYNTYLNMQNNIDLREINRLLKEIINLKEENIRLQKIIDDNEDDEK